MLSIQQIQYIIALADEKHFGKASEQCYVTQPTLSMQIKKAEEFLGHLVFDRSRSPLALTPFGEELIPVLRDIQSDYDKVEVLKDKFEGKFTERLKVAVIPTISSYLVPDMFDSWKKEMGNTELELIELKTEEIIDALNEQKIDMGIFAGPFVHDKMQVNPLFKEEIKAYYPDASSSVVMASELEEEHPWLLTPGNCLRTQMVHFCNIEKDENLKWNYEGGNIDLLMKMVDLEGGYTLVPYNYKRDDVKVKRIISSDGFVPVRDIIAVYPNRSIKSQSIKRIVRSIQLNYPPIPKDKQYQILNWK